MQTAMRETAVSTLSENPGEPEFHPSTRERLGIVVFVLFAAVASAAWVGLLIWGILKVAKAF
jgi:hypothetical protein